MLIARIKRERDALRSRTSRNAILVLEGAATLEMALKWTEILTRDALMEMFHSIGPHEVFEHSEPCAKCSSTRNYWNPVTGYYPVTDLRSPNAARHCVEIWAEVCVANAIEIFDSKIPPNPVQLNLLSSFFEISSLPDNQQTGCSPCD